VAHKRDVHTCGLGRAQTSGEEGLGCRGSCVGCRVQGVGCRV